MKNVEIRADGSKFVITYNGVERVAENFKWVPYLIGSLVGSLENVVINGIPFEKWVYIW